VQTVRMVVTVNNIGPITRKMRNRMQDIVRETTHNIEAGAKQRAPVRTGFLRNSIHSEFLGSMTGHVVVGAEYGIYVEMGTRYMSPRPYLLPSVETERVRFFAKMRALAP
jgi:HK97 gp10 family phage protein